MPFARCPLCDDILTIGVSVALDHPVTCPTCLANLKIVSLEPLEMEEATRRPPRPPRYNYPPRGQGPGGSNNGPRREGQGNWSGGSGPARDRRPATPPPPPLLPPNPDKLVDGKRAQKWDRPKQEVEDEVEDFNEFEDKFARNRGGKGKRGK